MHTMTADIQTLMALLGYVYLQNARPDKAVAILAALNRIAPGKPKVLRALSLALIRCGKPLRALEALDQLAIAGSSDAAFHVLRAQALQALDRPQEAAVAMGNYVHFRNSESQTHGLGMTRE